MHIKVFYVEDEPFLGRIVKESLESRDFEVCMIADGSHALAGFSEFKPDVCILDIMLPGKDGYMIAREIRTVSPQTPIIFLSAKSQVEDLLKGFDVGGNDYLRKPFSMEELIVRIHNLLKLTQSVRVTHQDIIPVGGYEFYPNRYELRWRDSIKKLSHREATLLSMLIENKNSTLLRKDILMKLWGDDSFFNSRNLDVYITKLRDCLKGDKNIQIITIKGIGYHFTCE
jgi:DNA-binding response OmpR family regulator